MVVANNEINSDNKYTSNAGRFDGHADAAVQCGVHCPIKRIRGSMQSHLMPPLGKCPRCIAPATAMVDNFERNKKTLTKHNFYLAFLW
jgi:hypothetical protein